MTLKENASFGCSVMLWQKNTIMTELLFSGDKNFWLFKNIKQVANTSPDFPCLVRFDSHTAVAPGVPPEKPTDREINFPKSSIATDTNESKH